MPSFFSLRISGNKKYKSAFLHFGISFAVAVLIWINKVNPYHLKLEMPSFFSLRISGNKKYKSAFLHFGISFAVAVLIWINKVNPYH
ncbi:hypothetical protein, partial [Gelidibacter salicanalis]|uniref:hypothetical protein n=1 Tax=Gelidibacter salicanalis TaxID=291193 RepID=UPI001B885453